MMVCVGNVLSGPCMRLLPTMRLLQSLILALLLAACSISIRPPSSDAPAGDRARVTRVIDGDTIEVEMNGVGYRVRYIGVNTPERDEVCYSEATAANAALVDGQTVTLVVDTSNTDRFGRLLRYVYVGSRFVNAELVAQGAAEATEYPPDTRHTADFRNLETAALRANAGCHPTGIFDDGTFTR